MIQRIWMVGSLAAVLVGAAGESQAVVNIDVVQVGGDVVATGSGTINVTDLQWAGGGFLGGGAVRGNPLVAAVGAVTEGDAYSGDITGPQSIGSSTMLYAANDNTGDLFGIFSVAESVPLMMIVPPEYSSGSALSGTATCLGQSIDDLGLTPGSYTWTWGSGANADSLTVNIAVPEPATMGLMAVAGGLLALRRRRLE